MTGDTLTPFQIKDCALISIATGRRVQNLREFRDQLSQVTEDSIYEHFWGSRLRPSFSDPEYNNDFAAWAYHGLHNAPLAERLGVIDPTGFESLEALRQDLLDVVEECLEESDYVLWANRDRMFHFLRSQMVVFDTHRQVNSVGDLAALMPHMSLGSVFYHFIDARRRTEGGVDDFRQWLADAGASHPRLSQGLAQVDYAFSTLTELRIKLAELFGGVAGGGE